jgi:hypothetical protein
MKPFFLFAFVSVTLSAAAAACSDSSTSASSDADAGGTGTVADGASATDATSEGSGDAGNPLIPDGVTKIVFTSKGGFVPTPPDGSTCSTVDITYTITLPARVFSWKICQAGADSGPNAFLTGEKILTAEQYAGIDDAIQALKRQTVPQCGADKPNEEITFTSPSGEVTYYDDFYFCDANDTKIYVSGMENVFSVMTMQVQ